MKTVNLSVEFDAGTLAEDVAFASDLSDNDIADFVLAIDEAIGDLSFTRMLRDRLQDLIDEVEDPADEEAVYG